ncbi:acyltransferase [Marinithermofilum abyssi]|uniref:Acyltransferase n=1 Tax=Marinithermofilum abyssi TaxID=1571185 RepID=A0A8J2VDX6_9BACL|nr:acyltransferase [Marinithermofilum abyssi]GGE03707.1 acyltransferase [Marinithermofilum abyssi]
MKENTKYSNYIYEVHFLRAWACLMILMVHVSAGFYYVHGESHHWSTLMLNQLSRFGTPMFAVISGFLLFHQRRRFEWKRFFYSRTVKVLIPFVLWTGVYLAIQVTVFDVQIAKGFKSFVVQYLYMGKGFYHLWFMSVVLQFYLVFPLLQRLLKGFRSWLAGVLAAFVINAWFAGDWVGDLLGSNSYLIHDKAFLFHWIFYFVFGGFLAFGWDRIRAWCREQRAAMLILAMLFIVEAVWETFTFGVAPSERWVNLVAVPVLCLAMVAWFPVLERLPGVYRAGLVIGQCSMGIYLTHPLWIMLIIRDMTHALWQPGTFGFTYGLFLALSVSGVKLAEKLPWHQYLFPIPQVRMQR